MAANNKAYSCLSSNSCGNNYANWYGTQTPSRLNSITSKHNKIATAFTGSWIAYCDGSECSPNVYAYVYPSDARRNIYFCSLFYANTDLIELINTPLCMKCLTFRLWRRREISGMGSPTAVRWPEATLIPRFPTLTTWATSLTM